MLKVLKLLVFCFATGGLMKMAWGQGDAVKTSDYSAFSFGFSLTLPGSPETVYDQATGDISEWWDHSVSGNPKALYIEPRPGGAFMEIFDDSGDGVLHATVTAADRGKLLRFVGPLGLAGHALLLSCTYTFEPVATDSTQMTLSVHGSGEVAQGWPEVIKGVWHHFLLEQFKPYVESNRHIKK